MKPSKIFLREAERLRQHLAGETETWCWCQPETDPEGRIQHNTSNGQLVNDQPPVPWSAIPLLLGQRLKHARNEKGWSITQACEASGLTRTMLIRLESGTIKKTGPTLFAVWAYSRSLNMPLGWLDDIPIGTLPTLRDNA